MGGDVNLAPTSIRLTDHLLKVGLEITSSMWARDHLVSVGLEVSSFGWGQGSSFTVGRDHLLQVELEHVEGGLDITSTDFTTIHLP